MSPYIIELNSHNLQETLQRSLELPVVVYFWAELAEESVTMKKMVETVAHQHNGAFILALVDCQSERQLAGQFGIQAIPTVAIFKDGQAVDGLSGEQTEEELSEMLLKHLPAPEQLTFQKAKKLIEEENYQEAYTLLIGLESLYSEQGEFQLSIALCAVELKQFEVAENWLNNIKLQDQDATYKSLLAAVELHKNASQSPEIQALQLKHQADPTDLLTSYQLALALSQVDQYAQALELLMTILSKDLSFNDGNAKKTMLDILTTLGQGNATATLYRRQLYTLLY